MKDMTLREVCENTGASRRAIQGYEAAGLVKHTGKTNRGYLLYNEDAVGRIQKVKKFQSLGMSVKQIAEVIDAPTEVLRQALTEQLEILKAERTHTEEAIQYIEKYLETLS